MNVFVTQRSATELWIRFGWGDVLFGGLRFLLRWYEANGWKRSHVIETPHTSQRFTYVLLADGGSET
jgi:hypothetical protein